ncbi:MAG TPA: arginase family protein [Bacteriovoracaceae bacterium]|nr:arginase family protein [Bacteriovoracaceae bacterium]
MKAITELLTLPGNGVYTVNTGKEKKEKLFAEYYGTKDVEKSKLIWLESLRRINTDRPWLLGIPSDNGGGIHRGANWGPLLLRQEILSERNKFFDLGDVRVIPHLLHDKYLNEATIKLCQKALYGKVNKLPVSPLSIAQRAVEDLYRAHPSARIVGLGGDHSTSYPLVKEWLASRRNLQRAAVLHFDAHTDLLDRRLGIDLCFGTWTYQILESLESKDHILQVGIRSSGKNKKHWKTALGVEQLWASEVNKWGVDKTFKKILAHYKRLDIEELYISFDIDALDEKYAAATGTPEKGGLLPSDCAALIRLLSREFRVTGADLMEVAPYVWQEGVDAKDQRSSLGVAGDLLKVLLSSIAK